MENLDNLSRLFFECPELDCEDINLYPMIISEEYMSMVMDYASDESLVKVYAYLSESISGLPYIEIYIWDKMLYPKQYFRIVIAEGYRLNAENESLFLKYIHSERMIIDKRQFDRFIIKARETFQHWHLEDYSYRQIEFVLEHLYFASHRSGVKEILYKAGLYRIAFFLDKVASVNLVGSTPESIIEPNISI